MHTQLTMSALQKVEQRLSSLPIIAILRGMTPIQSIEVAQKLLDAGIYNLEVPLNSPQPCQSIERIKNNLNTDLSIRGILLTMYDKRNKLSSQVEKEARDYFKEKVYQTVVPRNVRLSEAPSHGVPVLFYDKACPGSKSYFNFTEEFLNQEKIMESAA